MVALLNGYEDQEMMTHAQKLVVLGTDGTQEVRTLTDDISTHYTAMLSKTNVPGEIFHISNREGGLYISFYDSNLEISRDTNDVLLVELSE